MSAERFDLHTHSAVSDGTDPPAGLVAAAASARLDVIALCDHDTFDGLAEAATAGERLGVRVVAGVEMSTQLEGTSVHLLGFGARVDDAALADELARVRAGRDDRVPGIVARLAELGMPISEADVRAQAGDATSVGRPHIADALVAAGYARDRTEVFDRWLHDGGPAYVDRYATPLVKAMGLIHAAGGVAVIAHPWGRGSRSVLSLSALADLVERTGLDGLEVEHTDHGHATRATLRSLARRLGLLVTGGSDHHGVGKPANPLGVRMTSPEDFAALTERSAARGGSLWASAEAS